MSPFENIIREYESALLRDYEFPLEWEPLIRKVMGTLEITSLPEYHLTREDLGCPGKFIVNSLIFEAGREFGPLWRMFWEIKETPESTPYQDSTLYLIKTKTLPEVISKLTGHEVYESYSILQEISKSPVYQKLRKLNGIGVNIEFQ